MKMFGIPESTLAKSLREIEDGGVDLSPLEITTCLRKGAELEIDVRYTVDAEPLREELFDGLRERPVNIVRLCKRRHVVLVFLSGFL